MTFPSQTIVIGHIDTDLAPRDLIVTGFHTTVY